MKLYLSSYRIPHLQPLLDLIGIPVRDIRVGIIPNAKDYYAPRAKAFKCDELLAYFSQLGMKPSIVDLQNYSTLDSLRGTLSEFDLLWASGGNTFCLRHQMKRSGFDAVLSGLLESGIVYGGESAGALVACPSLEGVELADVPNFAEEVMYEGLSLVPFILIPHVENDFFREMSLEMKKLHTSKNREIIELTDSQALTYSDGTITIY